MNADRYCAYNLTRQRFVATDVESADGTSGGAEARLLQMELKEEAALWIFPYRKISPASARFPLDLILLDSESVVLDTVEFFPMNVAGATGAQATSLLVMAADSVAQGGIKVGDQLAISAPEEMMHYLQRAQNDGGYSPEPARVIPWPTNGARNMEPPAAVEDQQEPREDGAEPGKRKAAAIEEPKQKEPAADSSEPAESATAAAAAELPVREEPVEEPAVLASARTENEPPETAAGLALKEEPVVAVDFNRQAAAPAALLELPPVEESVQTSPGAAPERRDLPPPQVAAELPHTVEPVIVAPEFSRVAQAEMVTEAVQNVTPAPVPEVAPDIQRKEAATLVPAEAPRKVEPASTAAALPTVQREDTLPKIATEASSAPVTPHPLRVVPFELRPVNAPPIRVESHLANDETQPGSQTRQWREDEARRSWLKRLLRRKEKCDPRSAPRETLPGLVAYFFTGGVPAPHAVRDISATGMYLVTYERWYKGTVVQMTLTERAPSTRERSLTLHAQAVRLGSDGVGFRFLLEEDRHRSGRIFDIYAPTNGVDRQKVGRFIRHFRVTQAVAQ
jgi:hypothetical protein